MLRSGTRSNSMENLSERADKGGEGAMPIRFSITDLLTEREITDQVERSGELELGEPERRSEFRESD